MVRPSHLFLHTILAIYLLTKCRFGVTQVDYLGHIISKNGVLVDPEKTQAVNNWLVHVTDAGSGM